MIKIKFDLFVNNYNGGPKVKIYSDDVLLLQRTLTEKGHQTIELDVALKCPTKLTIEHYDKNMKYDTKLENGNIIEDKGFILEKIKFDNFVLENELYHFKFIKDNGEELKDNNYIGHNGKYTINIDSDELVTWYFKLQKSFINELENFDYAQFKEEILNGGSCEVNY